MDIISLPLSFLPGGAFINAVRDGEQEAVRVAKFLGIQGCIIIALALSFGWCWWGWHDETGRRVKDKAAAQAIIANRDAWVNTLANALNGETRVLNQQSAAVVKSAKAARDASKSAQASAERTIRSRRGVDAQARHVRALAAPIGPQKQVEDDVLKLGDL